MCVVRNSVDGSHSNLLAEAQEIEQADGQQSVQLLVLPNEHSRIFISLSDCYTMSHFRRNDNKLAIRCDNDVCLSVRLVDKWTATKRCKWPMEHKKSNRNVGL